jgi:Trm5-related predicted tRNA methylase
VDYFKKEIAVIDLFYLIKMIFRNSVFYKFRKIKDDSIFQEMTIEELEESLNINWNDLYSKKRRNNYY